MMYYKPMLLLALLLLAACGTARPPAPVDGHAEVRQGVIIVKNPTPDTWDLKLGGVPKGSIAPGSEAQLLDVAPGRYVLVADNTQLGLSQSIAVELGSVAVLKPLVGRLRAKNPHDVAIVLLIEGAEVGVIAAQSETVFEGVPAGKRTLILKTTRGPGAIRLERVLPPDGEAILNVPELDATMLDPNATKAPPGMGLVRFKNGGNLAVTLVANDVAQGVVQPGATHLLVLAPGSHRLEVHINGIEARTEHVVTLTANQVAEWEWGMP